MIKLTDEEKQYVKEQFIKVSDTMYDCAMRLFAIQASVFPDDLPVEQRKQIIESMLLSSANAMEAGIKTQMDTVIGNLKGGNYDKDSVS